MVSHMHTEYTHTCTRTQTHTRTHSEVQSVTERNIYVDTRSHKQELNACTQLHLDMVESTHTHLHRHATNFEHTHTHTHTHAHTQMHTGACHLQTGQNESFSS